MVMYFCGIDLRTRIELEFEESARHNFIRNSVRIMEKLCLIFIEKGGHREERN